MQTSRADAFFKPPAIQSVPDLDLLSWMLDEPPYPKDKPLYIDATNVNRFLTYTTCRDTICRLAAGLSAAGVRPGDCVQVHSFNDIYYSMLVLGIIAAGGVFSGSNPSYTPIELVHHIHTAKVKFIISEPEYLSNAATAAKRTNIPESNIWVFNTSPSQTVPAGFKSWQELLKYGVKDWVRHRKGDDAVMRLFSSGTTGLPKAANLSTKNLMVQHISNHEYLPRGYENPRFIAPLPMFHVASVPFNHTSILKAGYSSYVMRRFDLALYLSTITKHSITDLMMVPPLVLAIVNFLESPEGVKGGYSLRSVEAATCGAAPLDKELQARLKSHMKETARFTQVWGMTESSCIATRFYYPEADSTGSIGRLIPNLEAKIVDDNGNDISAYDIRGEICLRGPGVIQGYFENEKATSASWDKDGFYHTGDIGYCDKATGLWYIVDRKKELIKVRGFQVAPPEIEGVLLSHPDILDAAVIGIPVSGPDGELPRAYIVKAANSALTEEDVKAWVAERLSRYKRLEGGVRFVGAIPKNPSGKILKRELREWVKAELAEGTRQSKL